MVDLNKLEVNTGYGQTTDNLPQLEPIPDFIQDLRDFHAKFDLPIPDKVTGLPKDVYEYRFKFTDEENLEYEEACNNLRYILSQDTSNVEAINQQLNKIADALGDLIYVIFGTAVMHGIDLYAVWKNVHVANMAKVRAKSVKRKHYLDVVKPEGWEPPDHTNLIKDNVYNAGR